MNETLNRILLAGLVFFVAHAAACSSVPEPESPPFQAAPPPSADVEAWADEKPDTPPPSVPYVPTPYEVVREMLTLAGVGKDDVVYDLGSGDGRIVIMAVEEFDARKAVGVELKPDLIEQSNENARDAGVADRVRFLRQDLFETDLSEATVVTLYLLPEVNRRLRPKLFEELAPGSRVVSHSFDMGDWAPDETRHVDGRVLHFWVIPADVSGLWRWNLRFGEQERSYALRFDQVFQELGGRIETEGVELIVDEAVLSGEELRFSLSDKVDGRDLTLRFQGRVQGDMIQGTVLAEGSSFSDQQAWTAGRSVGELNR